MHIIRIAEVNDVITQEPYGCLKVYM